MRQCRHHALEALPCLRKQEFGSVRAVWIAIALIGLSIGVGGCSKHSTPTAPIQIPGGSDYVVIDNEPAWSHDGKTIAFHRAVATRYGPPGLYTLDLAADSLSLVAVGDAFSPTGIRFSPDDLSVLANWQGDLFRVRLDTKMREQIPIGTALALQADWARDGV